MRKVGREHLSPKSIYSENKMIKVSDFPRRKHLLKAKQSPALINSSVNEHQKHSVKRDSAKLAAHQEKHFTSTQLSGTKREKLFHWFFVLINNHKVSWEAKILATLFLLRTLWLGND